MEMKYKQKTLNTPACIQVKGLSASYRIENAIIYYIPDAYIEQISKYLCILYQILKPPGQYSQKIVCEKNFKRVNIQNLTETALKYLPYFIMICT